MREPVARKPHALTPKEKGSTRREKESPEEEASYTRRSRLGHTVVMNPITLLADIGGTNARFALSTGDAHDAPLLSSDSVRNYEVAGFRSLADAATHYLNEVGADKNDARPRRGVFAVAGRVDGDLAHVTNHPWVISQSRIGEALRLDGLQLVNDFAAQAMAIPYLRDEDIAAIGGVRWNRPAPDRDFTYAVIGAGTGLGVGALLRRDGRDHALQTEGGHTCFSPGTPEEIDILRQLAGEFGRVSNERLVSGNGLVNVHRALSAIAGEDPGPMTPKNIVEGAANDDPHCLHAVNIFCAVFGAAAGDLVLTLGAWDGVFLTGGMVPKMIRWIARSGFRQRFEHKGRFSPAMARVPTLAVMHPHPGLLGAAALALDG